MVIFNSFLLNYQRVPQNDNSEYRYKDDDEPVDLRDVPIDFLSKPNDLNGGIARIDRQKTDKNGILRWIIFLATPKLMETLYTCKLWRNHYLKHPGNCLASFLGLLQYNPQWRPTPQPPVICLMIPLSHYRKMYQKPWLAKLYSRL